ncbi:MAG: tannase/feruloyl esterase family alpha/beta hydrolase, partial [Candidatus Binataceae bacterium]
REAMVEAQKFPDDYNGIIAGDPAIGDPIAGFNWNDQALLASPASYLTPSAIETLDTAVTAACDQSDGVEDGLIQDPEFCHFNVRRLECHGHTSTNCLTEEQIATVEQIVAGAHTEDGDQIYPGYTLSNPGGGDGWIEWITGATQPTFNVAEPWGQPPLSLATAPLQWSFQDQFLKYFVFNNPAYDSLTFNINSNDLDLLQAAVTRNASNGENTDLEPFFSHGGKLIMYHGWSDPALTPLVSVNYYNEVAERTDGGIFELRDNARLFMVPGMHHCGGGSGPNVFNALPNLVAWVENGQAPNQIIATHCVNNNTSSCVPDRTMPLCPYPELAHYIGGNLDEASSWVCPSSLPPHGPPFFHDAHFMDLTR